MISLGSLPGWRPPPCQLVVSNLHEQGRLVMFSQPGLRAVDCTFPALVRLHAFSSVLLSSVSSKKNNSRAHIPGFKYLNTVI